MNHCFFLIVALFLSPVFGLKASTVLIGLRGGDVSNSPENTKLCLTSSFSNGLWGHEIDLRTTADGSVMLMRDGSVDRTTDGSGVFSDFTASEARALDAGSWMGPQFTGLKIPSLDEALSAIKLNGTRAYLDIKSATEESIKAAVISTEFNESQITFLTFYPGQSIRFINTFPTSEIFYSLFGKEFDGVIVKDSDLSYLSSIGVSGVTISHNHYTPQYIQAIHSYGLKLAIVGPIRDSQQLDTYINNEVDELWVDDVTTHLANYNNGLGIIDKPQVPTVLIGHRGGDASSAPENTVECLTNSFLKGIWGHEIDLRTTSDGSVMLMHDGSVNRTTNGSESIKNTVITSNFDEAQITFLTFYPGQSISFIDTFPTSEVFYSLFGKEYDGVAVKDSDLTYLASIGVKGVTISHRHYTPQYLQAIHSSGLKLAVVGAIRDIEQLNTYIEASVDELWVDDVSTYLDQFNNGQGVLATPRPALITDLRFNSASGDLLIKWDSVIGKDYSIEISQDLENWFTLHSHTSKSLTSSHIHEEAMKTYKSKLFYKISE